VLCIEMHTGAGERAGRLGGALIAATLAGVLAACGPAPAPPQPVTSAASSRALAPVAAAVAPVAALAPPRASQAQVNQDSRDSPAETLQTLQTLQQLRLRAAQRVVAANPQSTYLGPAPDPLLAIPVLEIELDANGNVRSIRVLRQPRQARDTTQLAIDAVRRAAPFGDVSHVPRPWKFTETFLFDDERRFKPRTLEE